MVDQKRRTRSFFLSYRRVGGHTDHPVFLSCHDRYWVSDISRENQGLSKIPHGLRLLIGK